MRTGKMLGLTEMFVLGLALFGTGTTYSPDELSSTGCGPGSIGNRPSRFIVHGNNNQVGNNVVTNNKNTNAASNSSTSGGSAGGTSGGSTGATSGGNTGGAAAAFFPKMTQSPQLSPPIIKPDTFVFKCHIPFDHTRTDVGFRVKWLYDGIPDPKTPVTQVTGSARDAYLDQKYIQGHLGRELTCVVNTYFLKSPVWKGPSVHSNPYWAGIKFSTPLLRVGSNEKPRTLQIISSIPVVCNRLNQAVCTLEIYLDPNNHDVRQATSCTQTLKPGDWNPVTHQAVTSFQVLAERDYRKDGDKNLALHFQPIFSVDAPWIFDNYQIPYLQIQPIVSTGPKSKNETYYCNCDQQRKLVDCRIVNNNRPAVHSHCPGCIVAPMAGGHPGNGRK